MSIALAAAGGPKSLRRLCLAGAAALLFTAAAASAHDENRNRRVACGDSASLTFEGNTSVSSATTVTSAPWSRPQDRR